VSDFFFPAFAASRRLCRSVLPFSAPIGGAH